LNFLIYFKLFYIVLSWSHDLDCEFDRLTHVQSGRFSILSFQYLKNKIVLNFFSQIIFLFVVPIVFGFAKSTRSRQVNPCLIFFSTRKILAKFRYFFMLKKN
jgi:hypothetical protein